MGGMLEVAAGAAPPPEAPGGLAAGAPGVVGRAGAADAVALGFTGTLFAGTPAAVGGPLAPTLGAFTGVTFGLFAATPGADACGAGVAGRCGFG